MGGKFENLIIVTDMDGTYVAKNDGGDARNRESIEYFKANGGHFTFATGRNIRQVFHSVPDAEDVVNLPIICSNGAYLYDLKSDRELAGYTMTPEDVITVVEKFNELSVLSECRGAGTEKNIACKRSDLTEKDSMEYLSSEFDKSILEIRSMDEWKDYRIYKCVFHGEAEATTAIREKMDPIFKDKFSIVQASTHYYEYHAKGVSKGSMISEMMKLIFGDRKMTLCVAGDFDNDVEMLKRADIAVCPENASDPVKAICHMQMCHHSKGLMGDLVEYLDKNYK